MLFLFLALSRKAAMHLKIPGAQKIDFRNTFASAMLATARTNTTSSLKAGILTLISNIYLIKKSNLGREANEGV
jgi:hypothetical protein